MMTPLPPARVSEERAGVEDPLYVANEGVALAVIAGATPMPCSSPHERCSLDTDVASVGCLGEVGGISPVRLRTGLGPTDC